MKLTNIGILFLIIGLVFISGCASQTYTPTTTPNTTPTTTQEPTTNNTPTVTPTIPLTNATNTTNSTNNGSIGGTTVQTKNVEISDFAFNPQEITINKGDSIMWTNKDTASHTIVSDTGSEINSPYALTNGQTYVHTFNTVGTYDYHCSIHASMKGRVIVQ